MRVILAILTLVASAAMYAGCSSEQPAPATRPPAAESSGAAQPEDAPATTPAPAAPRFTIGMSQCNLGEPWRVQMNADIRKTAEAHPELEVIYKDAQNDTLKQRAHIEEFLSQGVDLLIVSPKEPALRDTIAQVYKAGTPVIILDRDVPGDDFTQFIGANNYLIGRAAGEFIRQHLNGEGNVVELKGLMTTIPGQDRNRGFRDGISGSNIQVIFEADMQWLEGNARKEMESALSRFEDIDLVYAHNDPGAHGAYLAAKAAGRHQAIAFVGIDALPQEGQAYVREGLLSATLLYPTGGEEAIENALKILSGEEVPKKIVLNSRLFTRANIDAGGEFLRLDEGAPTAQAPAPAEVGDVTSEEADAIANEAKILEMQGRKAPAHEATTTEAPRPRKPAITPTDMIGESIENMEKKLRLKHGGVDAAADDRLDHTDDNELGLNDDPLDHTDDNELGLKDDPLDHTDDKELGLKNDPLDSRPNEAL